jgi:hypothetical protein
MKTKAPAESNRKDPYSVSPLGGEEAERFSKFDSLRPTEADIENLREAKEFYLEHCEGQKSRK